MLELSIVMPCLNEAETLEPCIMKARHLLQSQNILGEIIIADNGSTDGSIEIAQRLGARVVHVKTRGYGAACIAGSRNANGKFILMGDADDSYDFSSAANFVEKLRAGADLVMGNRFLGGIDPGAMPWKNRWIGNPVLSGIGKLFFRSRVGDFHCGLRAYKKAAFELMRLRATGMEFASEMVIKAHLMNLKVAEVPTKLHKDGRSRRPHLRPWKDGWRHLRLMLIYSPRWLFLYPGILFVLLGLAGGLIITLHPVFIGGIGFDINSLSVAATMACMGFQSILFALLTKVYGIKQGLLSNEIEKSLVYRAFTHSEWALVTGTILIFSGLSAVVVSLRVWAKHSFGMLDPTVTMRIMIPASLFLTFGAQVFFYGCFVGILQAPLGGSDQT